MDLLSKKSYYYDLPEELIAQTPIEPRDSSRLLVYDRKTGQIEHKIFHDIIDYLNAGDVLVVNNTRVLPARIYGYKDTGAKIEILLQKRLDLTNWEAIARPTKRLKVGTVLTFSEHLKCTVKEIGDYGCVKIEFAFDGVFEHRLSEVGSMPLPPYIK